jgi:hypothetical protein
LRCFADSEASEAAGAPEYDVAAALAKLKAEAAALSFGSHQDVLDDVAHLVEDANKRLAANNLNALDRYVKGEVAAYIGARQRRSERQYHFVFRCVPAEGVVLKVANSGIPPTMLDVQVDGCRSSADRKGNERQMLFSVRDLIESPKDIIASFVSLEPFKKRTDLRWQILASPSHHINEIHIGIAEGESNMVCGPSGSDGSGVSALVQDGAEIVSGVEENAGEFVGQLALKLDFVDMLRRIRLFINDVGPRLIVFEFGDSPFEIGDVVMCAN